MNFATYQDALDFARNNISYTGDKIKRVELVESGIALRALWDSSWDKLSQHAGLYDSK
jgi:hypothetical protein